MADSRLAQAALFLTLLALSLALWPGVAADPATLAQGAVATALAQRQGWQAEAVQWLAAPLLATGAQGLPVPTAGPALLLLAAPLAWLAARLPDVGPLHGALLLAPLLHAVTGARLYAAARRLSPAGRGPALAATLLWALGSPALAALGALHGGALLALALLGAWDALARYRHGQAPRDALSCALWMALLPLAGARALPYVALMGGVMGAATVGGWAIHHAGQRRAAPTPALLSALTAPWVQERLLLFALPVLGGVLLAVGAQWAVHGQVGLGALPAAGLFLGPWLLPWGLLLVVGSVQALREERLLGVIAASALAVALATGDLLPALPLLALLVVPLWGPRGSSAPLLWAATLLAVALTLLPALGLLAEGAESIRLVALRAALALAGLFGAGVTWARGRGVALFTSALLVVLVACWLLLGDLRAFQQPALVEVLSLLPAQPTAGGELWYAAPDEAMPLLNNAPATLRLVGISATTDELRAAQQRAEAARAPIFLLLRRDEGAQGPLAALLRARLPLRSSSGNARYLLLEFAP